MASEAAWSNFFDAWEAKYDEKERQQNLEIEKMSAELTDSIIRKSVFELKRESK